MWVRLRRAAGRADRFRVCVWAHDDRVAGVQARFQRYGLQVDDAFGLSTTPEGVAVATDWLISRGCGADHIPGTPLRWRVKGRPTDALGFLIGSELRLPDLLAAGSQSILDAVMARGRSPALSTPHALPVICITSTTERGRHALNAWRVERGAIGERLLALAALRDGHLDVTPGHLAALDRRLLQLARLEIVARPAAQGSDPTALLTLADGLLDGTALSQLWQWINAAQRRADAGRTVDFTVPMVLGLHPVSRLRIIP